MRRNLLLSTAMIRLRRLALLPSGRNTTELIRTPNARGLRKVDARGLAATSPIDEAHISPIVSTGHLTSTLDCLPSPLAVRPTALAAGPLPGRSPHPGHVGGGNVDSAGCERRAARPGPAVRIARYPQPDPQPVMMSRVPGSRESSPADHDPAA